MMHIATLWSKQVLHKQTFESSKNGLFLQKKTMFSPHFYRISNVEDMFPLIFSPPVNFMFCLIWEVEKKQQRTTNRLKCTFLKVE